MLKAEEFKDSISERSGITCSMVDERLSTVGAAKQLRESGMSTRESKAAIDQAAAVAILEQALAIEKRK
jgi:putative Holliday junction resolvase